jgi:DNA-binding transcriptional MerR regulator
MEQRLSIDDLAQAADVPVRTVRYYISEGLLPGPGARGRAAAYDAEHLARLQLIRRLVEQHLPLVEVRARLAELSPADVEALLRTEQRRDAALRRARQTSPQHYISGLLDQARAARSASEVVAQPGQVIPDPVLAPSSGGADEPPTWRRWELAPGVELHVRADAAQDHAVLIESLRAISRTTPGR